jgi:hypothetical protein
MLMWRRSGVELVLRVRSLATYLAGSQYMTCESLRLVLTSMAGMGALASCVEVVVGGVAEHGGEGFGLVGVAPFFVLGDGEGQGGVEHGVHDVDEGDVGEDDAEEVGRAC